jgi:integrase
MASPPRAVHPVTRVRFTGDVVLIGPAHVQPIRRLPVRDLLWLPERRIECVEMHIATAAPERPRSPIIQPGYRRGEKPGNWGKTYPADPLTPDEVLALMAACPTGRIGTRNRALIALLWRSGLRISEALDLLPHHVDMVAGTVTVLKGKGSKRRTVGIDQGGLDYVAEWLERRAQLRLPAGAPLFCTASRPDPGGRVGSAYVRELFHELGEKAGITKRVHPHVLRHTLACELAREGVPIHLISRQLGHSNLGTTATYLAGIAPQEVFDAIHARSIPEPRVAVLA